MVTNVLHLLTVLCKSAIFYAISQSHLTTNTSWNDNYTYPSLSHQLKEMLRFLPQTEGTNSSHPVFFFFFSKQRKYLNPLFWCPNNSPISVFVIDADEGNKVILLQLPFTLTLQPCCHRKGA